MLYVAERALHWPGEPSAIIKSLEVADVEAHALQDFGYWPSYDRITPEQRRCYLQWLARGRRDDDPAQRSLGYIFVFFYGIERRILCDKDRDPTLLDEVLKLLEHYGRSHKSRSLRSYLSQLIHFGGWQLGRENYRALWPRLLSLDSDRPDAFSEAGQDWGMPLYRWDVIAAEDFRWLGERARRSADLYDGYRVDHLVGFYRTYFRLKHGGKGFFSPEDEPSQLALGERVLAVLRGAGAEIIAEDLGIVPDLVRASLARLGVPGFRVFRWERQWHVDGQPFRDPSEYPPVSVAASGTHDTEPLAVWWDAVSEIERRQIRDLPTVRQVSAGADLTHAAYDPVIRDALLEALFASGSDLLLLPVQDAFGWRDRINEPATVTDENWTFRLPWPADRLDEIADARERKDRMRAWSERHGRLMADG